MTQKHIEQVEQQIPANERITRMYKAFEGDYRVITENEKGNEKRYTCILTEEGNVEIVPF